MTASRLAGPPPPGAAGGDGRGDGLRAVAAPVWGTRGELAAIIGVQGPASRFDGTAMQAAVAPLLEQTARVSGQLGWNGLVKEVQGR